MKKTLAFILALCLCIGLCACGEYTEPTTEPALAVPDVTGSEEAIAKNILSAQGLFPDVQYAYSDTVAEGNVIETVPAVGITVVQGSTVVVYISKGPSVVKPKSGKFRFDDVYKDSLDNMKVSVHKENDILYIDCDVIFLSVGTKYVVPEVGYASTDEDFMFSIPIKITNISQNIYEDIASHNKFTIEIPLDELGDSTPERIYLNLDRIEYPNGPDSYKSVYKKRAWFAFEW